MSEFPKAHIKQEGASHCPACGLAVNRFDLEPCVPRVKLENAIAAMTDAHFHDLLLDFNVEVHGFIGDANESGFVDFCFEVSSPSAGGKSRQECGNVVRNYVTALFEIVAANTAEVFVRHAPSLEFQQDFESDIVFAKGYVRGAFRYGDGPAKIVQPDTQPEVRLFQ